MKLGIIIAKKKRWKKPKKYNNKHIINLLSCFSYKYKKNSLMAYFIIKFLIEIII